MITEAIQIIDEMLPRCRWEYSSSLMDIQRAYCYRQLNFIRVLAQDAIPLVEQSGGYAAAIITRSILESLLRLGAAAESAGICLRLLHTDADEDLRRSKFFQAVFPNPGEKWEEVIGGLERDIDALAALTPDSLKTINLFESTPVGGLRSLYRTSYHVFSQVAHANYTIIDLCLKKQKLASSCIATLTLFVCLAGIVTSDLFKLESHGYSKRLRKLHPDLTVKDS